jgi:hypothetical protein
MRTNASLVQAIMGNDYDKKNAPDLTPCIAAASAMVDAVTACAASRGFFLSPAQDQLGELIERWLAAHFYQAQDKGYKSKGTSKASASFQAQGGSGLEETEYGKRALLLDVSGCLEAYDKRKVAVMFWGGKPVSEQIPYVERN